MTEVIEAPSRAPILRLAPPRPGGVGSSLDFARDPERAKRVEGLRIPPHGRWRRCHGFCPWGSTGWRSGGVAVVLGAALLTWPIVAQARDRGITQEQADAILSELKAIRTLLEQQQAAGVVPPAARPAPPVQDVTVSIENSPSLGRADAPLTLVEFADYQCPFCTRFHTGAFEQLKQNYIDTGKVRFVSRDLPLAFHGQAEKAAQAARCAGEQDADAYWTMRHQLLTNASTLSEENMIRYAQELSLDTDSFTACLTSGKHAAAVQRDLAEANAAGLSGTPSFVLGRVSGTTVEGTAIVGAQPYQNFEANIKELLAANE